MIIGKGCLRQGGTGGRFNRMNRNIFAVEFIINKREGQSGKIAAAAGASDNDIRVLADFFHLFFGFEADNRLVEHDVVQNAAQGIAGFAGFIGHRCFHRFADGNAQTAGRVRTLFKDLLAGLGFGAGAGDAVCAPGRHHGFAVGFLVEADADHKHLAFETELGTGKGQGAAPLAGTGFGGQFFDAEFFVVICLGHRRIGLVAPGRTDAFIFIIDPGRRIQCFFKRIRSYQRAGTPDIVYPQNFFGNIDPALRADFLLDEIHREYRCQHIRRYWAFRSHGWIHLDISQNIVPLPRYFIFS